MDAQAIGSERGPGTQARPLTVGVFEAALGAGVRGADGHGVTQARLRACQRADDARDAPVRPRVVVVGRDMQDSQRTIAWPAASADARLARHASAGCQVPPSLPCMRP